jgi:hypothetical protein
MSFVKVRGLVTGIKWRWSLDGGGVPGLGDRGNMVELLIVGVVGLLVISAQREALLNARNTEITARTC